MADAALDQLNDRHFGGVAAARPNLCDAGITARTFFIRRTDLIKQLFDHRLLGDKSHGLSLGGQAVILADGDILLRHSADLFGPRDGGLNPAVLQQAGDHAAKHGKPVVGFSAEFSGTGH